MEMEKDCLKNRLWKWKRTVWATAYGNGKGLFGQPLIETERDCWGNRLWKWKGTVGATACLVVIQNTKKELDRNLD
jgi:hypothetical protein